jgi:hypothetical protein
LDEALAALGIELAGGILLQPPGESAHPAERGLEIRQTIQCFAQFYRLTSENPFRLLSGHAKHRFDYSPCRPMHRMWPGSLVVMCAGCAFLPARPYHPVEPIPASIVDMHCHIAGIGAGGSRCFVSRQLQNNWP